MAVKGRPLQDIRGEHGVSQRDLARRSGVHRAIILRLEKGQSVPKGRTLTAIAAVFGLTKEDIAIPCARAQKPKRVKKRRRRKCPSCGAKIPPP